jgi:signal transduction histidine kinase
LERIEMQRQPGKGTGEQIVNLKRIFEHFYTVREAGKGTGLGLSTTYDIITSRNGEIPVKRNGESDDLYGPPAAG